MSRRCSRESLTDGGSAGAFARAPLLEAIRGALIAKGIDVTNVLSQQRLVLVDASRSWTPSCPTTCRTGRSSVREVAPVIDRLRQRGTPIHLYGEMVDLLSERGNSQGALRLEQLWNEIAREQPFSVLCGYRLGTLANDIDCLEQICAQHDGVERDTAQALAQLAERARALQVEVDRRRRTEQRLHELLVVKTELAAAIDRDEIARLVVEKGRAAVGAQSSGVWAFVDSQTELELLCASQGSEQDANKFTRVPVDSDVPAAHVARTGEPLFLASPDEYKAMFPASYERFASLQNTYRAMAHHPVAGKRHTLGVMVYSYASEHAFEDSERTFQCLLARQCALALDRFRMQREERTLREAAERLAAAETQARGDVELLYELIASANRLDNVDEVYTLALRTVMRGTRSDRAAILLFDDDDVMRFQASVNLSERSTPLSRATRRGRDTISILHRSPSTTPKPIRSGRCSRSSAPERHSRARVRAAHQPSPAADRPVRCCIATRRVRSRRAISSSPRRSRSTSRRRVERKRKERELARAYREEREAHLLADEATRAREEILSVVSHDLRNPLGAIMMARARCCTSAPTTAAAASDANVERIHRQAERMARYIQRPRRLRGHRGRTHRARSPRAPPEEILTAASDMFAPIARSAASGSRRGVLPDLPAIECDSDRAVQVLTNLVANALKVTPKGGAVSIGAEPKDNGVVFYVRDTGPGIEADELPNLFERHWRSKTSSYKGAGLGLSIARGIVDAHGGRIWAESRVGAGSTFYFSLEPAPGRRTEPADLPELGRLTRPGPVSNIPDACPR